jgi:hypothetical protein
VAQNQTVTLTLQGDGTNWVNGQTQAVFFNNITDENGNSLQGANFGGNGISVAGNPTLDPANVTVTDATDATVQISASAAAAIGPWTLQMTTPPQPPQYSGGDEIDTMSAAVTVTAPNPPGSAAASVTTIAGTVGAGGFADGAGTSAQFNQPSLIAVGPDDSIYVADEGNNRIRVVKNVSGQWTVSTYAGNGTAGYVDGAAASAEFNQPEGVAVDPLGNGLCGRQAEQQDSKDHGRRDGINLRRFGKVRPYGRPGNRRSLLSARRHNCGQRWEPVRDRPQLHTIYSNDRHVG